MNSFIQVLSKYIDPNKRGSARDFCDKTGCSSSYLSEIFNKGKLPNVASFSDLLVKYGMPDADRRLVIYALSREKTQQNPDCEQFVTMTEDSLTRMRKIVRDLAHACVQGGVKLPEEILERIKALEV